MSAINLNIMDIAPKYGAKELKSFINKFTFRGFIATTIVSLTLALLYFNFLENLHGTKVITLYPPLTTDIFDLPVANQTTDAVPPPPEMPIKAGSEQRGGVPVPLPDAMIKPDLAEFATIDQIDKASPSGGDGLNPNLFPTSNSTTPTLIDVKKKDVEPDPEVFLPVEKEPGVDYQKLQRLVVYPELARKNGIEGTVTLRVLIDKDGVVRKLFVIDSENLLLEEAAINAVKSYGKFNPAIQNQEPIMCWVSIPIKFKLR